MLFVGIDLAWSPKNRTGIAVIEGNKRKGKLLVAHNVLTDDEIVGAVQEYVEAEDAIIAIDAPIIVPNEKGRRSAEALTSALFRKYDAGAHPSNRKRLGQWGGGIRGEEIGKRLAKLGYRDDPDISKHCTGRRYIEVYPHPSMVVIFGLDKILRYKAKPKRDHEFLVREFKRYQSSLKGLENAKPSLHLPSDLIERDLSDVRGKKLKSYEDTLDAVFCAYIAYYGWSRPDDCAVLGSMEAGYIFTPIFPYMRKILKEKEEQRTLQ